MPRLPTDQRDKIKSSVVSHVDVYKAQRRRAHVDKDVISGSLGMSYPTLWKRLKNPGDFTLDNLFNIANTMNISLASLLGLE